MGHAGIQTTMIYVHHVPKAAAADELTRAVEEATGATGDQESPDGVRAFRVEAQGEARAG